ncbi:glycoside hydrolase family 18 protein [Curvularia clavata]|uniref:chitinase n=1 Tax=Curvularia clavata TaxID=95742 RepID=A0A9Q8ZHK9_CURCL|nr:glycoside hydrolase family 18 protein [Curvularia clavata]
MRLWIPASFGLLAGCLASTTEILPGASTLCQGNCEKLPIPACDKNSAKRHVGYFEASNIRRRPCEQIWPGRLNTTGFTHVTLGFAVFDPKTFTVAMERHDDKEVEVYRQFLRLPDNVQTLDTKERLTKSKAIGGWNMSNEGPTHTAWSDMSSTKANRRAFIDSLKHFLDTWKFSGIEIHWEWPGAWNRGGNPTDAQNQVDLIHELRDYFGKDFGISVVVPAQHQYLKNMNLLKMQDAVDWFTILTYDLHGPWDAFIPDLGPKIKPHTDLAEIDAALNLLSSAQLDPAKINMGIANYGRGFTVADQSCKYYGCKFTGPSKAGTCTKEEGLLSACEIRRIIKEKNLEPQIIQGGAGVKAISWDDQWIGYDDDDTLGLKLELANKRCLGGTSLWSLEHNHCDAHVDVPSTPGPVVPAPPVSEHSAQPTPVSPTTPIQVSIAPQPPNSSNGPKLPSHVSSGPMGSLPSNPPIPTSSIQGSAAASSVQGSTPSLPSPPNTQPLFQSSPSSVDWTGTAVPSLGRSGLPSSRSSSGQESSVAGSSGFTSAVSGSGTDHSLSTTSMLAVPIIPGVSSWPIQSSVAPTSNVSSSPNPSFLLTSATLSISQSSSTIGASSAQVSIPLGSSAGPSITAVVPIIPINPSLASPTTTNTQGSWQTGSTIHGGFSTAVPKTSASSPNNPSQTLSSSSGPILQSSGTAIPSSQSNPVESTSLPPAASLIRSSTKPSPTATGCPNECRNLDWCVIFCVGWKFPRPDYVQPPHECLLPENAGWCRTWWWGIPPDKDHNGGDPDSHSDSDPECKPNDCVSDCVKWRIATFFIFKRPVCPCVPKKCDKDGESDSPSDSDRDDPKVKPSPTSRPKGKRPECRLFGCGCGWMGLDFGPGCPGLEFEIPSPCGLFGCNPCVFFGCPGTQPEGIVGYDGYCPGGGCEPCPTELCSRPGCTIPGGCGPKPGPAPTKPPNRPDPEACDDTKWTVITERFVWCTEGFNVSALPSSLRGTSSTMISSLCLPMIDATVTMCGGAIPGFDTTTTATGTNTLTSDGPACTRAPLSLDDDEGDNNPGDPLRTSRTFAGNTTVMTSSKASFSSPSTAKTTPSSSSISSTTAPPPTTSKTTPPPPSTTTTSFAQPLPSLGPMDKYGHWRVALSQYMFNDYSEVGWKLYDPNGNLAGEHNVHGNRMKEMKDYIESMNRPIQHMMPFGVDMTVLEPLDLHKCRVNFEIKKSMPECNYSKEVGCRLYFTTESFTEEMPFVVSVCQAACSAKGKKPVLVPSDLWCQDLNDADWEPMSNGWKRQFECGWKGF